MRQFALCISRSPTVGCMLSSLLYYAGILRKPFQIRKILTHRILLSAAAHDFSLIHWNTTRMENIWLRHEKIQLLCYGRIAAV